MAEASGQSVGEAVTTRAMLFWLGDQCCAVAAELVIRVVAAQPLTRLPLLPPEIAGVVALAGKVVPVIDLCPMLDLPESGLGEKQLVLIALGPESYVFRVDRVVQIAEGVWTQSGQWHGTTVRFIDVEALLEQRLQLRVAAPIALMVGARQDVAPAPAMPGGQAAVASPGASAALMVETARARELLPLDGVAEISETLPIASVPDPSPLMAGAAFHRDALLPVIGLDALLGRPEAGRSAWGAFVVIEAAGRRCVLAVKRVIGLSSETATDRIVDLEALLTALLPEPQVRGQPALPLRAAAVPSAPVETRYLLVELAGRTCAFSLPSVAHIHAASRVVRIPAVHLGVAGLTAIGGRLFPVLDLATLLGLSIEPARSQFVELKTAETGSFVVAVERIVGIAAIASDALVRAPEGGVISAVARRDAALVWILTASLIAARGGWRHDAA